MSRNRIGQVYTYDSNDRLTNRLDALSHQTQYFYDAVANLTNVVYNTSTNIQLSYDALNRLTNMVDAAGATVFNYSSFGALLSEDGPWANDTVSYTYDNGRRRSGLTLLSPVTLKPATKGRIEPATDSA